MNKCIEFINLWDEIIEKYNGNQSMKYKKLIKFNKSIDEEKVSRKQFCKKSWKKNSVEKLKKSLLKKKMLEK